MLASATLSPASSAFAINAPVLLASILNFSFLVFLLWLVFTKFIPIHKWARQRSSEIKAALEQAESVKRESAASRQELEKKLQEAENIIRANMILGIAFAEAIAIYALIVGVIAAFVITPPPGY